MKTPEEIKKGLECCAYDKCEECPYKENACVDRLIPYALAYIKRLEVGNAELLEKNEQLERERDAAVWDMHNLQGATCSYCKNLYRPDGAKHCVCREFGNLSDVFGDNALNPLVCSKFEWRGVCEENGGISK